MAGEGPAEYGVNPALRNCSGDCSAFDCES